MRDAEFLVEIRTANHGFAKLIVKEDLDDEGTQIDVGFDPAEEAAVEMSFGPVRALDDLAGDKLLALFARATPRAFVDVHALRRRFTRAELIAFDTLARVALTLNRHGRYRRSFDQPRWRSLVSSVFDVELEWVLGRPFRVKVAAKTPQLWQRQMIFEPVGSLLHTNDVIEGGGRSPSHRSHHLE